MIKAGTSEAAEAVWENCFPELSRYARARLVGLPARREVAEDVALSAIESFMQRARAGKFRQLEQPEDLWKLLYRIAACKAAAYRRKRANQSPTISPDAVQGMVSTTDDLQHLMDDLLAMLSDGSMRDIGKYRLCGYTNREIAEQVGCATETVRRKLVFIKQKWNQERERWLNA
jgi:DNA-directed RNA polymerase specialized sigma24 family protein